MHLSRYSVIMTDWTNADKADGLNWAVQVTCDGVRRGGTLDVVYNTMLSAKGSAKNEGSWYAI